VKDEKAKPAEKCPYCGAEGKEIVIYSNKMFGCQKCGMVWIRNPDGSVH
jgi:uncharacterized Zn finger protein